MPFLRPRFLPPLLLSGAILGALALSGLIKSQRAAAQLPTAQFATAQLPLAPVAVNSGNVLGGPIGRLAAPPSKSLQNSPNQVAAPVIRPVSTPIPNPTPIPVLKPRFVGQKIVRVGLSTAGGAVAVYLPGGATLFDLNQPNLTLSLPPGERIGFAFGPPRTSKRGSQIFRGPISVSTSKAIFDGWTRVYIAVNGDSARVSTNNNSPRYGRPYRGDLEVFPQRLAEPVKRKGPLALVNVVPLEAYLKGVVPWEMGPSAPLEALKAQAICARTKTLDFVNSKKFAPGDFDICDYDSCQGYPGTENEKPRTSQAVEATRGLALFQNGRPIDAVYSTNSGGITAAARDVWKASSPISYLESVPDFPASSPIAKLWKDGMTEADWAQFCAQDFPSYARPDGIASTRYEARKYRWNQLISVEEATKAFVNDGISRVLSLQVMERTPSGRIRRLRVTGEDAKFQAMPTPIPTPVDLEDLHPIDSLAPPTKFVDLEGDAKIRAMFSKRLGSTTALPSSLFTISPQTDAAGQVTGWNLQGAGWGHGVGMCQRGAQNHAIEGWDARRILNWYFRGVEVRKFDLG